ncbi:hypothetical protein ScPMuIL_001789 [Solemya velum]
MSVIEKDFRKYDETGSWPMVYQKIRNESSLKAIADGLTIGEAKKPENRSRNRYRDVSPYDHSRVILKKNDNDYINASLVTVPEACRRYILTQGPLEQTISQFWQMVWEQKSKAILMLNRTIEKGTLKCHQYWPMGEEHGSIDEMVMEDVGLKVTWIEQEAMHDFNLTTLELEDTVSGTSREIFHFQYMTWPDFGVPTSPAEFLNFLMAVREYGVLEENVGPAVIHCSAGIGRSGTFCLVDSSLLLIEKTKDMNSFDLMSVLIDMRSYRMGLIQTPDQLRFSYMAIIEGGHQILADKNSTLDVVSSYIANHEDSPPPPPPPVRTTSLSPQHISNRPPPPSSRPPSRKTISRQNALEPTTEISDSVDNRLTPEQEPDEDPSSLQGDEQHNSMYAVRRRKREDRKKNTNEQIKRMKEKQRKSELRFRRRDYIRPLAVGLAILLGGYILYRYYWKY